MDRVATEAATLAKMIALFCRSRHNAAPEDCAACRELLRYAQERLRHCRYGNRKRACRNCPTHCYAPRQREQIRQVMRVAGPRMLWRHPLAVFRHLLGF